VQSPGARNPNYGLTPMVHMMPAGRSGRRRQFRAGLARRTGFSRASSWIPSDDPGPRPVFRHLHHMSGCYAYASASTSVCDLDRAAVPAGRALRHAWHGTERQVPSLDVSHWTGVLHNHVLNPHPISHPGRAGHAVLCYIPTTYSTSVLIEPYPPHSIGASDSRQSGACICQSSFSPSAVRNCEQPHDRR
jgi:hypothetical protein